MTRHGGQFWLLGLGAAQVVAGGLVAAVSGPLSFDQGSWLVAYLVLVGGVAQYLMGRALQWFDLGSVGPAWLLPLAWNAGNALVIIGTLTDVPALVDVGGVLLVAALVLHAIALLRAHTDQFAMPSRVRTIARIVYLLWLIALAVSVPIGLVLAQLQAG